MRNVVAGWPLRRLYMNGTTATIALGGAYRHNLERRLIKLAVVAAGR